MDKFIQDIKDLTEDKVSYGNTKIGEHAWLVGGEIPKWMQENAPVVEQVRREHLLPYVGREMKGEVRYGRNASDVTAVVMLCARLEYALQPYL